MGGGAVNRVAITGLGMITPLGTSAPECWANMLAGRSGVRRITRFSTDGLKTKIGGELPDRYYEMEAAEFPKRFMAQTNSTVRLAFLCAREAMADAGFSLEGRDPHRVAVITGSGVSDFAQWRQYGDGKEVPQYVIIRQMANAIAAWITIRFKLKGPSYNIATACASGAFAAAAGLDYIRYGRGDAALVVGADMLLTPESIFGFNQLMALSEQNDSPETASCPFDRRRSGFVLSNGSGALLLENMETARRRGARIYAELSGAGICSEAYNIVAPEPSGIGIAQCMAMALADGRVPPERIGYISAHGTSTQQNDAEETAGIKRLFGERARSIPVSSQKSMIGHTIGGAGAIECAVTALSLYHRKITPTINYAVPDPACDLDYVPNQCRDAPGLEAAISNSFGFGGHNCALVLERVR